MMIRVKLVIIISREGARAKRVTRSRASSTPKEAAVPSPEPRSTVTEAA